MSTHLNILHVEDFEGDAFLFSACLEDINDGNTYTVDWAPSIKDAQDKFRKNDYNINFIDHGLPGMSGIDLVKQNKSLLQGVPCILLTGSYSKAIIDESTDAGFLGYLLKDEISPSLLKRTINYSIKSKAMALELEREQSFASFIISSLPDIILTLSDDGMIQTCNENIFNSLGFLPSDVIGKDWNLCFSTLKNNIDFKTIDPNLVVPTLNKNNEECFFEWNALERVYDINAHKQRNKTEYILVGKNITQRMISQEHKRQRDKMEALGQLAGGMAHEISNYLQPVVFATEIAKTKAQPTTQEYLDIILRNTLAAKDVLKDILTFSRKDEKQSEPINILSTLNDAINFAATLLPNSFELIKHGFDAEDTFMANIKPSDLILIISNLLMNASQAIKQHGTVSVTYATANLNDNSAQKKSLKEGDYAIITVADNGPGVAQGDLERIFQPFFTTKPVGEGTGLGLSMTYGIVSQWGGSIEVENIKPSGAQFKIYIPATPKDS